MFHRKPGRRREFLPPPKDTQSDLGNTAPDRPHVHRKEVPQNPSRCTRQARRRCCFGLPPFDCAVDAQNEEELKGGDKPTSEVQHHSPKGYQQAGRVPGPTCTRAAGRRDVVSLRKSQIFAWLRWYRYSRQLLMNSGKIGRCFKAWLLHLVMLVP